MGDISLVDGWLPWFVVVLCIGTLVLAVRWHSGRWRAQLRWGAVLTIGGVGLAYLLNETLDLIPWSFPLSFYALAGLVVFAMTAAVVGFRHERNWKRLDGLVSVVASLALLGVVVNAHYQYLPTVANLFGKVAENEVGLPELQQIRDEVRSTGQLPAKGSTLHVAIPGTTSGFDARDAYLYVPPAFFADPAPTLPVLMLLHGTPGGPEDWLVGGEADQVADAFAARNDGKAPILVMPDATGGDFADTECVDSSRGHAETYLTVDVANYVSHTLDVGSSRWGIAGLSMGGFCSLMLSLRHPQQFVVFGDYSGLSQPTLDPPDTALADLFGGDQQTMDAHDPTKILAGAHLSGLAGWFEVGESDSQPLEATRAVATQATQAGITACLLVRSGGHDFAFWHQALENSLPWISTQLGLLAPPAPTNGARCTGS
ncbi:MAG TPA: alpha/beta hydrolase-fold protein [Acidimicrobiales bacterium]